MEEEGLSRIFGAAWLAICVSWLGIDKLGGLRVGGVGHFFQDPLLYAVK